MSVEVDIADGADWMYASLLGEQLERFGVPPSSSSIGSCWLYGPHGKNSMMGSKIEQEL